MMITMINMVKVNVTVFVPEGEYCDVCTSESIAETSLRNPDGSIRIIRNKVKGTWDYRCPFAAYVNPRSMCALFDDATLKEVPYIAGDPIAHRLKKCEKCKAVSAQVAMDLSVGGGAP